ncbi:MAG: hypothetical protein JRI51_10225, partial [Deltaproteobacteria bacterium]|nr:hypothetical protein [Deltaproteobacteria bacterium]
EVLWEYQASPVRVLTERQSTIIKDILRNVVLHGTGRRAKKAVNLSIRAQDLVLNIPVPTFGKTGTANRFTNSSFAGFVARLDQRIPAWDSSKGFVITAYVGYDDNKPMKSKHTEIYGASGALPLWIDTAVAIVNSPAYVSNVQLADLAFETLEDEATNRVGLKKIAVSPISGLPISTGIIPEQGQEIPVVLSDVKKSSSTGCLSLLEDLTDEKNLHGFNPHCHPSHVLKLCTDLAAAWARSISGKEGHVTS